MKFRSMQILTVIAVVAAMISDFGFASAGTAFGHSSQTHVDGTRVDDTLNESPGNEAPGSLESFPASLASAIAADCESTDVMKISRIDCAAASLGMLGASSSRTNEE
jgi:hypothetical protein